MQTLITKLYNDEAGFIISAELVLVSTVAVLSMVVGLSEVSININNELEDVGSAFACVQQSYCTRGASGHKGQFSGSHFQDQVDFCASEFDIR